MLRKFLERVNLIRPRECLESDDLSSLYSLSEDLIREAVREGELKVASQFQSHLATEQRGYTIAGLTLTLATGAMAAYSASRQKDAPFHDIGPLAITLTVGLLFSTVISILSVWPTQFHQPGNHPKNWLPRNWNAPHKKSKAKWAMVEQANALQIQISDNALTARIRAHRQRLSILVVFITVTITGLQAILP